MRIVVQTLTRVHKQRLYEDRGISCYLYWWREEGELVVDHSMQIFSIRFDSKNQNYHVTLADQQTVISDLPSNHPIEVRYEELPDEDWRYSSDKSVYLR